MTSNSTITLTFGDCAENHVGMAKYGTLAENGFSLEDLEKIHTSITNSKLIHLTQTPAQPAAAVLVIPNGVNLLLEGSGFTVDDLYKEQLQLDWDKKALMYKRVVNKLARWNLCYDTVAAEPDYAAGKGRVIAWESIPVTSALYKNLPKFFGEKAADLKGEGNYYYDNSKCGIGFHGDAERRKVIAVRLGAALPINYQWYKDEKSVGERQIIELNGGDMYIMSEKAVGTDWKRSSIWTLRHAAGCAKYTT